MGVVFTFLSIWVCSFLIARALSPYSKAHWKNDVIITFAQSLIISILIVFFFKSLLRLTVQDSATRIKEK
ncbi:uncharacterized membrane protein YjjP (DUF1212 family) [Bacillus sp. SORGH_AS 510]|nr:uncharacterized membrane protein YjjP (DUF1212 family) [Bacillus sp. SORGH_AS_0510]